MNAVKIISATSYRYSACSATSEISKEDHYEQALLYRDCIEDELDYLKVYKVGSMALVDSGKAHTFVKYSLELSNINKTKGTPLKYADGGVGKRISIKGNLTQI